MSRKDCEHTKSALSKIKDAVLGLKPDFNWQNVYCSQCGKMLKPEEILNLKARAEREIENDRQRLKELAEKNRSRRD